MKKKFEGYLILNWKNKQMAVRKTKPKGLNPFEIPVKVSIDVTIPQIPNIEVRGELEIPETQVGEMVIESI